MHRPQSVGLGCLLAGTVLVGSAASKRSATFSLPRGYGSAAEAASAPHREGRKDASFAALFQPDDVDTTTVPYDFEEEERHLAREITVFVIVSAFVAYFIVKVFFEKDEEPEPPPKQGKQVPVLSPKAGSW